MNFNIEEIIIRFEALQKEFHRPRGSLIHTLDDNLAIYFLAKLSWKEGFNQYVPDVLLLCATVDVVVFGQIFQVELWKPIKNIPKTEFEDFFGFTYDKITQKREYDSNRVVAQFAKDINSKIDVRQLLYSVKMRNWEKEKDVIFDVTSAKGLPVELSEQIFNPLKKDGEEYLKNVLRLMVLGGYVKYWEAIAKYKQWFKDQGFNTNIDEMSTSSLLFK